MVNLESPKKSFWQFPIALKFLVVWIFLLSLGGFWAAVDGLISAHTIKIVSFIAGFVYFYLAIGLADRDNTARILTSIVVGAGTLVRFVLLIMTIFFKEVGAHILYDSVKYPVSRTQQMIFLIVNILLNAGILYILLQHNTRTLFSRQSVPVAESDLQKTT